jgi:hypothetical protein
MVFSLCGHFSPITRRVRLLIPSSSGDPLTGTSDQDCGVRALSTRGLISLHLKSVPVEKRK